MTNYVYSVFDHGTGLYSPPIVAANDDMAVRNYLYVYGKPDKVRQLCTEFRRIGVWNNETGVFDSVDPENISGSLHNFVSMLDSFQDECKGLGDSDGEKTEA